MSMANDLEFLESNLLPDSLLFNDEFEAHEPYYQLDELNGTSLPVQLPVQLPQQQPALSFLATGAQPAVEEYPGPYNFGINVEGLSEGGKNWEFCDALRKVYMRMGTRFPISFSCEHHSVQHMDLRVRALMMFKLKELEPLSVTRCHNHASMTDESNQSFADILHVVRVNTDGARYDVDPVSGRTSVVVPLGHPQPGTGTVTHVYRFMCKNSCQGGMNRNATQVVFTLEDVTGGVLGRTAMSVRICSCPRRDRLKDEADMQPKNADMQGGQRVNKRKLAKVKLEDDSADDSPEDADNLPVINDIKCLDQRHKRGMLCAILNHGLGSLRARAASELRAMNATELALQQEYLDKMAALQDGH